MDFCNNIGGSHETNEGRGAAVVTCPDWISLMVGNGAGSCRWLRSQTLNFPFFHYKTAVLLQHTSVSSPLELVKAAKLASENVSVQQRLEENNKNSALI